MAVILLLPRPLRSRGLGSAVLVLVLLVADVLLLVVLLLLHVVVLVLVALVVAELLPRVLEEVEDEVPEEHLDLVLVVLVDARLPLHVVDEQVVGVDEDGRVVVLEGLKKKTCCESEQRCPVNMVLKSPERS